MDKLVLLLFQPLRFLQENRYKILKFSEMSKANDFRRTHFAKLCVDVVMISCGYFSGNVLFRVSCDVVQKLLGSRHRN